MSAKQPHLLVHWCRCKVIANFKVLVRHCEKAKGAYLWPTSFTWRRCDLYRTLVDVWIMTGKKTNKKNKHELQKEFPELIFFIFSLVIHPSRHKCITIKINKDKFNIHNIHGSENSLVANDCKIFVSVCLRVPKKRPWTPHARTAVPAGPPRRCRTPSRSSATPAHRAQWCPGRRWERQSLWAKTTSTNQHNQRLAGKGCQPPTEANCLPLKK